MQSKFNADFTANSPEEIWGLLETKPYQTGIAYKGVVFEKSGTLYYAYRDGNTTYYNCTLLDIHDTINKLN